MSRTLWYTRCPVATATGVALEKGLFDAAFAGSGVEFRNIRELGAERMLKTHFDHTLPDSVREGGAIPPIWARSRGADTALLGLTWVRDSLVFLVHADSDIQRFTDLSGRRCSLPRHPRILTDFMRANTERGFVCALAEHGMTEADVQFVDTVVDEDFKAVANPAAGAARQRYESAMFDAELAALLAGRVDVIFAKNGQGARLLRLHAGKIRPIYDLLDARDEDHIINGNPRIVTISRNTLNEAPEIAIRYAQGLLRGAAWAAAHKRETTEIWAAEMGLEVADVANTYRGDYHQTVWPSLSDAMRHRLRVQIAFLRARGYLEAGLDIEAWAAPEILAQAYAREGLEAAA
jgi:sulfonate transport system substrate-binding protein